MNNTKDDLKSDSLKEETNEVIQIDTLKEKEINIKMLEHEIDIYKKEIKEIKLRSQAEIENIRRRTEMDIEKIYKFSLEKFISELLPVIDSLERSLELSSELKNDDIVIITKGIELTLQVILNTVKKFGVNVINDINVPFNPDIHQAISTAESDQIESNNILTVVQKGYTLNNRLLRPSMVIVSKKTNTFKKD